ncbi:TlpA disulfide reductase family protein [Spirosoma sp. SC4-14]|uniref:TlpA disulfide reductase family protein n=1 Tax=Spirosoma sp. SC4-14 TaxID=3128900 RepID=UPI0030D52565
MIVTRPLHQSVVIDTAVVHNRSATFSVNLAEPSPAYLWVDGNKEDVHFFIDSPRIDLSIDPTASIQPLISGSSSSELWFEYKTRQNQLHDALPDWRIEMENALHNGDSLTAFRLKHEIDSLLITDQNTIAQMILAHPTVPSSWYLFATSYFPYAQKQAIFRQLSSFSAYPSFKEISQKIAQKKLGQKAPDFSLPNQTGTNITLSTLTNRYILLDFSIPTVLDCQQRHQELKQLYAKYYKLGLEIVTISVEFDKTLRLDALKDYPLPWIQVQAFMNSSIIQDKFAIDRMPDNVLLDANRIMIGRDMTVAELDAQLNDLLHN